MCGFVAAISPTARFGPVWLGDWYEPECRPHHSVGLVMLNDAPTDHRVMVSQRSADSVERGRDRPYKQTEIFEQPGPLAKTRELIDNGAGLHPGVFGVGFGATSLLGGVPPVLIQACDTSYHSGGTGRDWLKSLAGTSYTVTATWMFSPMRTATSPKPSSPELCDRRSIAATCRLSCTQYPLLVNHTPLPKGTVLDKPRNLANSITGEQASDNKLK